MVLFALLLGQANWVQVVKAGDYRNDSRNQRVLLRTYDRERGAIVVGTGSGRTSVARSVETTDTLKFLRTYPGAEVYAPVTGFASLVYGFSGIERREDDVLGGEDERLLVRRLSDYITGRKLVGGSVLLTLDPRAQDAAWKALAGRRGAVVALDPRTGAVLAMVSFPSYDPATVSSHDPKAIRAAYEALVDDPRDPLLNRAVERTYPPGSTFKLVTAAAALSSTYEPKSRLASPRVLDLPGTTADLHNFAGESCGAATVTLTDALRTSCNTAFGGLGMALGEERLASQAQAFGIGDDDLRLPQRVATSVFPRDLTKAQQAQSAIGQYDVRVTPLQMAMVTAAIANRGELMRPYLVREVLAPDLSTLSLTDPKVWRRAVSSTVAEQLTAMMELVVKSGTGTRAQIAGVRVAGKTGTAQHLEGRPAHNWFVGFAPAVEPQIAVAVVLEEGGGTGGRLAAPIAKAVMQAVLR
jgi:peptidoglycan glycosyltransferase